MSTEQLTLNPDTAKRLRALADKLHRPSKTLLEEAVENYLGLQNWQLEDIQQGMVEADAGDFATTSEMQKTIDEFRHDTK